MEANGTGRTKRDWLAFDRADYLGTKIILGIAVVGSVLFGLVGPVVSAVTNAPLPVSYTTKITSGIELPRGATHDGEATMELLLTNATLGERLTQALPEFLIAGLTIAVAWMLFQLLRSTQAREPFTLRNVRRINTIALVIGLGWIVVQFAQGVADNAIQTMGRLPDNGDLAFVFTFTPLPLVVMLVIALIGEAFRRGVQIRDDVEGLV
ncbi:MAG TPA: DUF2975 domain-containing protein [Nocardioidaceae bacterium]|nr:DUF2975 domain-containing protein [Nocardioidaceae bacterium]